MLGGAGTAGLICGGSTERPLPLLPLPAACLHAPPAARAPSHPTPGQEGLEDHWHAGGRAGGRAFRSAYLELWDKLVRASLQLCSTP